MSILYDAATLLDSIRIAGGLNSVQTEGNDDARLLQDVYEVMREKVIPHLLSVREEYLVRTIRSSVASPVTRYRIPARAVGNNLRDIWFRDANNSAFRLHRLAREDVPYHNSEGSSYPVGFYMEGNYAQLVPTDGKFEGSLEMAYHLAPSVLVKASEAGVVLSVDLPNRKVTLSGTPPGSFISGAKIDLHSPENGAETKLFDLTLSGNPASNVLTFTEAIDGTAFGTSAAAVGDYVCLARECAVLQVPEDLVPLVVNLVALRHSIGAGDGSKAQMLASAVKECQKDSLNVLSNRIQGKPRRVTGRGQVQGWCR